jgi:hypothetical protein
LRQFIENDSNLKEKFAGPLIGYYEHCRKDLNLSDKALIAEVNKAHFSIVGNLLGNLNDKITCSPIETINDLKSPEEIKRIQRENQEQLNISKGIYDSDHI